MFNRGGNANQGHHAAKETNWNHRCKANEISTLFPRAGLSGRDYKPSDLWDVKHIPCHHRFGRLNLIRRSGSGPIPYRYRRYICSWPRLPYSNKSPSPKLHLLTADRGSCWWSDNRLKKGVTSYSLIRLVCDFCTSHLAYGLYVRSCKTGEGLVLASKD